MPGTPGVVSMMVCPGDADFSRLTDANTAQQTIITIDAGAASRGADAFGQNPKNVPAGNTVVWVNKDSVAHTVTSTPDARTFDSGNINPGCAWARRFDDKGNYGYMCRIHPNMTGELSVN